MVVGSNIEITTEELTPVGPRPVRRRFKVAGLFETGFYELDDNWTYTSIAAAQKAMETDQINQSS